VEASAANGMTATAATTGCSYGASDRRQGKSRSSGDREDLTFDGG
jgi:hypothetical protein